MNWRSRKLFVYLQLQLKNAFLFVPKIFLIFVIFSGLLFGIGIYGNQILSENSSVEELSIAVVFPKKDYLSSMTFSFLNKMQSVRELLTFVPMEREEAFEHLKKEDVFAVIEIPDLFIEGILNGSNVPAKISLSEKHSLENILFRNLLDAGVSILGTAQAGIYAVDDILFSYQMFDSIPEMEEALNQIYLSFTLNRDTYFKSKKVGLTDHLSTIQFYGVSFCLLLILYSGMAIDNFFKENVSFEKSITREGILLFFSQIIKVISLTFCYWILLIPCFFISSFFPDIRIHLPHLSISFYFLLFPFLFSVISFFYLLHEISQKSNNYILLLCALSTIFLFCSGGIIPKQFLPSSIQKLGLFLPSSFWLNYLKKIILHTTTLPILFSCLMLGSCFFILSLFLHSFSNHK